MRIIKLDILGLRRRDEFNINKFAPFYSLSPATLLAKKIFFACNKIDILKNFNQLTLSWEKIMKKVGNTIDNANADKQGREMTKAYKERYDEWMTEYKKWCNDFFRRRGRRLIQ